MKIWIVSSLDEETIQGRKLFKGGSYMRKYGIFFLQNFNYMYQTRMKHPFTKLSKILPIYEQYSTFATDAASYMHSEHFSDAKIKNSLWVDSNAAFI